MFGAMVMQFMLRMRLNVIVTVVLSVLVVDGHILSSYSSCECGYVGGF